MDKFYEIIGRMDDAFGKIVDTGIRNIAENEGNIQSILLALRDAEVLLSDAEITLRIDTAITLSNNCQGAIKYLLLMKYPDQALEAFRIQYMIPAHIGSKEEESEKLYDFMCARLEELCGVAWNASQRRPFVEAGLTAPLGISPAAMRLKSQLYFLKADILMREKQPDAALLCLLDSYYCISDVAFRSHPSLFETRIEHMERIRDCLAAKGDRRLSGWIEQKLTPTASNGAGDLPSVFRESWPCAAFGMRDATEAYEHMRGYKCIMRYGAGENGRYHIGEDGGRSLCRCGKCGGYILVQKSELHGAEDAIFIDFFPVTGPGGAKALNSQFDAETIETHFPEKYLINDGGKVSWHTLHPSNAKDDS